MKHTEMTWSAHDGLNLYAQSWSPERRDPKAVVCLIHGLGEHTARYGHVARALCDGGLAVIGADLRGHGRSGGPRGHLDSIESILKDIDLLLAEAGRAHPGVPQVLYGHSLGGVFALNYCLKRRPPLAGVIAASPGLRTALEAQPLKTLAARVLGVLLPRVTLATGLDPQTLSRNSQVVRAYIDDPLVHDRASLSFGRILLATTRWTREHAGEFPLPLLLLHGGRDRLVFPAGSREFAARLGDRCTLRLYEEAFHELHNEPEQEQVMRVVLDWIEARLAALR